MQNVTTTNLQTNLNVAEVKNTLGIKGDKIMCVLVDKTQESNRKKQPDSLQADYERALSNITGRMVMCTIDQEKANSVIDNITDNTILSPPYPTATENHLFAQPTNVHSHNPELKHAHSPDNIAETVKKFDEEQKEQLKKEEKLMSINNAFAMLNKPKKVTQYELMQKFIKLVPTITQQGKVFLYNGTYYEMAKPDFVKQRIVELLRQDLKDKSASYVNGIYQFLKIEPSIAVSDDVIRRDLLTFNNLILNLETGETYELSPRYITTYQIRANYLPEYNHNTYHFDRFLNQITGFDNILSQRILEIIGYCLTSENSSKSLFLYQGQGSTGKSLLTSLQSRLLSPSVVYSMKATSLQKPFAIGELYNRILSICNDMPSEALDEKTTGTLKELSGRDLLSSSVKYSEDIVFQNYSKVILVSNHAIKTKTPDEPFYRRIVCVPFAYPVVPEDIDVNLLDKLWQERDGIVSLAMAAYFQLKYRNYVFSGNYEPNTVVVQNETSENDVEANILKYLHESFEVENGAITFVVDALENYLKKYPDITINSFSPYFKYLAHEIFGADEDRKRRHSGANAQSCVIGIKFKGM